MATTDTIAAEAVCEVTGPLTAERYQEICHQFDCSTELVKGEIVEMVRPTPIHGVVIKNISAILWNWARSGDHGVIDGESGMITERDPDSVRGPDVFFVPLDQLQDGKVPSTWYDIPPKLVVKVLSANDRWKDVQLKIEEYLTFGVDEVWVVEPELHRLDIIRENTPNRSLTGNTQVTSDALPGFTAPLEDFFYRC